MSDALWRAHRSAPLHDDPSGCGNRDEEGPVLCRWLEEAPGSLTCVVCGNELHPLGIKVMTYDAPIRRVIR